MADFIDEIVGKKELQSVFVEQWDKEIYFYRFTLADMDYANKHAKGSEADFIAYTIIRKCLDENGKPLFSVKDKAKLRNNVQSDILANIVIKMKGEDVGDVDADDMAADLGND